MAHLLHAPSSRRTSGCQHRLFFSQVEYCNNLVFRRRPTLDALSERLLDANRTIGRPDKLAIIFGHRVSKRHSGKLKSTIKDLHLGNPVIRSYLEINRTATGRIRTDTDHLWRRTYVTRQNTLRRVK